MTDTRAHRHIGAAEVDLAVQRIRLRLGLRLAWLAHLAQLGLSDAEIVSGDRDRLDDELEWRRHAAPLELLDALTVAEESLARRNGRLGALTEIFGLSAPELDLVHMCLAVAVDDRIGRVCARLHGDDQRRYVTEALASRVCDRDAAVLATSESPARLWRLVVDEPVAPGEAPAVRLDRTIVAWLLGVAELDQRLVGVVRAGAAPAPLASWPVEELAARWTSGSTPPTRVIVRARPGSGRRSFAAAVCDAIGVGAAEVETDRIVPELWGPTFAAVQRQSFLDGTAPVWAGERAASSMWPASPQFPIQFVCVDPDQRVAPVDELIDVVVDLPPPSIADRDRLWSSYVPTSIEWPEPDRSDLVERPHVLPADIVDVARQGASSIVDARELLRHRNRDRLGPLVSPMPLPFGRGDLVVPERTAEALDFLVFECRERRRFWERGERARLYPQSGLVALLAGPPGVGKTMTAQVVAAELGIDLLRVNIAETISKYIGETAKNLDLVLSQARDLDAVLLCDEADTLFGKRTDVHDARDRWANSDTNFLLQAIETFPGIALLATNRKDQIDEAFARRLRHVIELAAPDAAARFHLWRAYLVDVEPDLNIDDLDDLVPRLAQNIELTGAEIKHAVMNAAFAAAREHHRIDAAAIVEGLDRELAKQGRSLSDLDRRRVLHG
jgi:hypothetical protein